MQTTLQFIYFLTHFVVQIFTVWKTANKKNARNVFSYIQEVKDDQIITNKTILQNFL